MDFEHEKNILIGGHTRKPKLISTPPPPPLTRDENDRRKVEKFIKSILDFFIFPFKFLQSNFLSSSAVVLLESFTIPGNRFRASLVNSKMSAGANT